MSASRSSNWILAASRRRASYGDLRISDAERAEVADMLATHYEDGRLDAAEFDQRLDQAMRARTYKDLNGLFTDLPVTGGSGGPEAPEVRARRSLGPRSHRLLFIVLIVAIATVAGRALMWSLTPWAWIGLLCLIILLAVRGAKGTS